MANETSNPTILDIAKHCGLSKSTVGYIVSGSNKYKPSERSKKLVMKAMKELKYRPNISARNLRTAKSNTIGILIYTLADRFYADMVEHLQIALSERGYTAMFSFPSSPKQMEKSLKHLWSQGVDGIINFMVRYRDKFEDYNWPLVNYGAESPEESTHVLTDVGECVFKATKHLYELGHKKIAFLGYIHPHSHRYIAYKKALEHFGLQFRKSDVSWNGYLYQGGLEGIKSVMHQPDPPTAVICHNDPVAIGALSGAHKMGIKVPDDLSIIGGNNILESEYVVPGLTTFDFPIKDIANTLCELAIKKIESTSYTNEEVKYTPEIVMRNSTAKPKV